MTVDRAPIGALPLEGSRFRFSRTPASPINPPPTMAQHNYDVLSGILGYDDERIARLIADAILE